MLFRLVRPVRRKGSSIPYFVQRIPADVREAAVGLRLAVPIGQETVTVPLSSRASTVRLSLRSRDPSEAKMRQAQVVAYLEGVWSALRQDAAISLTHRQATALAGELYRSWANGDRTRTVAIEHIPGEGWRRVYEETQEERTAYADATVAMWEKVGASGNAAELEKPLGALVDRLLLARGIKRVDEPSRALLLEAFWLALRDAFANLKRNAEGDYSPDPKSERFPEWAPPAGLGKREPAPRRAAAQTLTGLVEDWWREARATGLAISTYESYRNSMKRFVAFLKHDDANRVTPEDVIAFKDHRFGEGVSAKTIKDNDIAGLKRVFGWAVTNLRLQSNPAAGVTIKLGKQRRTRSKGFTEAEAKAVLTHALHHKRGQEKAKTAAAKRWVPWLCAYTGARVGEVVQLRKQDVRKEGRNWTITITPDAGTVKTNEAREVPLHRHLVELGFTKWVEKAPAGYLFLTPDAAGEIRGAWRGMKNRIAEFVREVVPDRHVAPSHAWRHLFKTIGIEVGIQERVLDAICGHAPKTVGQTYGEVTMNAKVAAVARIPRFRT